MSEPLDDPPWASELPDVGAARQPTAEAPAWATQVDKPIPTRPRSSTKPVRRPARVRTAEAAADEPELTWAETGEQAARNALPSLWNTGKSLVHAVIHPDETLKSLADLGGGLLSQGAGVIGFKQDPKEKAKTEALARAVEHHYATTYGSMKGFKKTLATDPASIALDASTLLSGGASAAGKVAGLEKLASVAAKTANVLDPVANAVRVAKIPLKVAAPAVRGLSGAATGVPPSLLKIAGRAGETANPAAREAFLRFYTGQGDATEFLQTAQGALGKLREGASQAYLAKKATLAKAQPSFQPLDDAIAKARAETMKGGINVGQFKEANKALDDVEDLVTGWRSAPDPSYQTLEGFDNLKQAIWDLRDATGNASAQRHLGAVYNAAKQAIVDLDPEYAKLMEQYQVARNSIIDTQKTLVGAGKNPSATTAMAKSLRALKTGTGKNLFAEMSAYEPTLPYMLAGHALHPWAAGGKAGLFEGTMAVPLAAVTGVLAHDPVLGGAQLAAHAAAQSPKVAGAVAYGLGSLGRGLERGAPLARAPIYADRFGDERSPGGLEGPIFATPEEVDLATRMVMAEAGAEPDVGKAAAIHTALNRARLTGMSLSDVLEEPNAFEPVTSGKVAEFSPDSPEYKRIRDEIVIPALEGDLPDPTEGATHFLNKDLVRKRGDPIPAWAEGEGEMIGRHTFYRHPEDFLEDRPHRAEGGRVDESRINTLVERLMQRADAAKRSEQQVTKPLLKADDEAVARALDVAQQAI